MFQKIHLVVSSLALIGVLLLFMSKSNSGQQTKVAYVESNRVLENYPPMHQLRQELSALNQVYEHKVDSAMSAFDRKVKTYENKRATLNETEQQKQEALLTEQQKMTLQYTESLKERAQQASQDAMTKLSTEVNNLIKEYGRDHNYQLILGANGNGTLAYADNGMNITNELIEYLQEEWK